MMSKDRDAALTTFDAGKAAFVEVIDKTPEAALRFRPAGEDYALGGLAVHVAQVLERYARVLEAMRATETGSVAEPPSESATDEEDARLVHAGFDDALRPAVIERVSRAHARVAKAVQAVPADAFEQARPVTYAGASEPFATSPADILGWVHDHYTEHVLQVTQLCAAWAAAAR